MTLYFTIIILKRQCGFVFGIVSELKLRSDSLPKLTDKNSLLMTFYTVDIRPIAEMRRTILILFHVQNIRMVIEWSFPMNSANVERRRTRCRLQGRRMCVMRKKKKKIVLMIRVSVSWFTMMTELVRLFVWSLDEKDRRFCPVLLNVNILDACILTCTIAKYDIRVACEDNITRRLNREDVWRKIIIVTLLLSRLRRVCWRWYFLYR